MNKRFESLKSFSDIVDAMIRGLEKKWVKVDMDSYGTTGGTEDTCFGCAATNTLCELMQESFKPDEVGYVEGRTAKFNYNISTSDLNYFERGINRLRLGEIHVCLGYLNELSKEFSFRLPSSEDATPPKLLPMLYNHNWEADLHYYKEYRDWLKQKGL